MTKRGLTQIAVAFILGVIGFEVQGFVRLWIWGAFGIWMAFVLCRKKCREVQAYAADFLQKQTQGPVHGEKECLQKQTQGSVHGENGCPPRRLKGRSVQVMLQLGVVLLFLLLGWWRSGQQQALIRQAKQYLAQQELLRVSGTIFRKEEQDEEVIYYLKNSYFDQNGRVSCGRVLVYHQADVYSIGDTICVTGTGSEFRSARNEGNFDERSYYYSKGILFRLRAQTVVRTKRVKFAFREALYRLKKQVAQVYAHHLPIEEAGVLSRMALGEKRLLKPEVKQLYQQAGIAHILAISGLHISLLGMGIYRFLRKRGISYRISGCAAGAAVLCFGQIAGMELSARRAVLMFLVLLAGQAAGMAYDSVTALSLASLVQLWEYPQSLYQASFLFSYGAVLSVVAAARIWRDFCRGCLPEKKRMKRKKSAGKKVLSLFGETLVTSSLIQLVTLPLTVYFYYEFPVYGVLANGLLLPLTGMLLLFGLVGGGIGLFCAPLAGLLLQPAHWLLGWNVFICEKLQCLPGAVWITGRPGIVWMGGYYLILVLSLYGMYRFMKQQKRRRSERERSERGCGGGRRKQGQGQKEKGQRLVPGACALVVLRVLLCVLPIAFLLLLLLHAGVRGKTQICFLDVGQGDGIFFQTEEAAFFLDGGSSDERRVGEYRILSFLKSRGIGRLSGWLVSHGDWDHISGLKEVWESGYRIEHLFLAQGMVRDDAREELCALARQYGTEIHTLQPGDVLCSGSLSLTCLAPWEEKSDRNEGSLVLSARLGEADQCLRALFAGDIGEQTEHLLLNRYPNLRADLYKASHHGSNGSNSEKFLTKLGPALTVISCGANNRYGHPGKEAVARIKNCGSQMISTMDCGQITVEWRQGRMQVWCYCKF